MRQCIRQKGYYFTKDIISLILSFTPIVFSSPTRGFNPYFERFEPVDSSIKKYKYKLISSWCPMDILLEIKDNIVEVRSEFNKEYHCCMICFLKYNPWLDDGEYDVSHIKVDHVMYKHKIMGHFKCMSHTNGYSSIHWQDSIISNKIIHLNNETIRDVFIANCEFNSIIFNNCKITNTLFIYTKNIVKFINCKLPKVKDFQGTISFE